MLFTALPIFTVFASGSSDGMAGCTNSTCFSDCYEQKQLSVDNPLNSKVECLFECYRDPCGWGLEWTGNYPTCNGTTGHIEGRNAWLGDVNSTNENCDYICGDCQMPTGYGPKGSYQATFQSFAPGGMEQRLQDGHTWTVTLEFAPEDYTADLTFKLDNPSDLCHYTGSCDKPSNMNDWNFEFTCENEPYKMAYRNSASIELLFVTDGQQYSKCLRSHLEKYYITIDGFPIWFDEDHISFHFTRKVPGGDILPGGAVVHWNATGVRNFYEVPDVVFTNLKRVTSAHTPSPTQALEDGFLQQEVPTVWVVVLGLSAGILLLALTWTCYQLKKLEVRGPLQEPIFERQAIA